MARALLLPTLLLAVVSRPAAVVAADFLIPGGEGASLSETKAICTNNMSQCWFVSYVRPSQPVCGSDGTTYGGECHLCSAILYKKLTITKLHDGPCKNS